ncbi:Arfrp1 [Symbiodinium sp. KB8]|nr:Arfrp1 [Symbiodinium sp. KB8]
MAMVGLLLVSDAKIKSPVPLPFLHMNLLRRHSFMFSLLCGLWQWLLEKEERRMVLLGVDNAGKTTTLEKLKSLFGLKGMPPERIPPTIGFNIGRIQIDKVIAVFWDLGGHSSFRSVWHNYYSEVQGVMFIVDSADPIRIEEAKATLVEVINHDKLKGVPLLCLANKQDKPEALSIQELSRLFEFERLFSERPFHVHPCCALQGQGLEAGVRWLLAEADKFARQSMQQK